jgi:3-hydroxyisobutyrate dehydrogenase-like beta-hydroxyacid dehydrogenase
MDLMNMAEQAPTLGFIGLGVMGGAMCRNVVTRHGAPVWAFDMSAAALAEAGAAGAKIAASVAEVAAHADIIFLSLPGGKQVEAVCLGEGGLASAGRAGQIIVDLSTTGVSEARDFAVRLAVKGILFADAPVARTRQAAIDGTLSIMVGADEALFAQIEPLLRYMGSDVNRCGDIGCGQVIKLINNTLLFENVAAIAEMMVVGERNGVSAETLIKVVSMGSGDSFALRNHAAKAMAPRAFPEKSFPSTYVLKDMGYAIDLAEQSGVEPRVAKLAREYYNSAVESGIGEKYFPAIIELIDKEG